jgi:hypothetical protein
MPGITFPSPPLRFRTAGFPQYGSKSDCSAGNLRAAESHRRLICRQWPGRPETPCFPHCVGRGSARSCLPIQRPLAPQRVMLSRRIIAYYGLIRPSGPLPAPYAIAFGAGSLPLGRGQKFPILLCLSFFPCRLLYHGGQAAYGCSSSRPRWPSPCPKRLGIREFHAEDGSRVAPFSRLQSSHQAAAREVARPSPTRACTFELSFRESPP